jgi:hypothetical protein
MTATIRVARFLQDRGGSWGQSEDRRVLGDSGNGGGSDSLALFGSTEHEGFVNSEKIIDQYE